MAVPSICFDAVLQINKRCPDPAQPSTFLIVYKSKLVLVYWKINPLKYGQII